MTEQVFGTIRNSTALKQFDNYKRRWWCFGTIRNSTALKQHSKLVHLFRRFGTIRNSTALKLVPCIPCFSQVLEPSETAQL